MKRFSALLCALLLLFSVSLADEPFSFVYGKSQAGRELECLQLGSADAPRRFLMVFGVHGFEDAFDHDGQVLKDIALLIAGHYASSLPDGAALYVVPCANPDGLLDGVSKDGFGRCSLCGIDINRDFPEKWTRKTTPRSLTGDAPFATPEARALRDLVQTVQPSAAADVHGWIHRVYGSRSLSKLFSKALDCPVKQYSGGGLFGEWLGTVCPEAVTVELPAGPGREGYAEKVSAQLISALDSYFGK